MGPMPREIPYRYHGTRPARAAARRQGGDPEGA